MNIVSFNYSCSAEPSSHVGRDKILRLEAALRKLPQIEAPVFHHFSEGIYARELHIPKGATLTGKIHRKAHLNVLAKGKILVQTEHGMKHLTAPCVIESFPGIKRAGHALEDTVWITFHATSETDLEKIEAEFIAPDFDSLECQTVLEDKT